MHIIIKLEMKMVNKMTKLPTSISETTQKAKVRLNHNK